MADLVRTHHQRGKHSHEEADTPICVHAKHVTIEGYKALIIEATDVVVIAVSVMTSLQELVWREYGLDLDKGGRYGGSRFMS